MGHKQAQRKDHGWTQGELDHLQVTERRFRRNRLCQHLTVTSGLQNSKKNVCRLSYGACSTQLRQPRQANRPPHSFPTLPAPQERHHWDFLVGRIKTRDLPLPPLPTNPFLDPGTFVDLKSWENSSEQEHTPHWPDSLLPLTDAPHMLGSKTDLLPRSQRNSVGRPILFPFSNEETHGHRLRQFAMST